MRTFKLGRIAEAAAALLRQHPEGLSMREMRELLGATDSQEHFNRRVRTIRKVFDLLVTRRGSEHVYRLGERAAIPAHDSGTVSEKLRAAALHAAHGRCQMCGRTIEQDGIKLQIDHRLPASWGGRTEIDNLWAICEACNRGKKDFFASFDQSEMSELAAYASVHERIAHLLRLRIGEPVPSYLLEFIANATEQQDDWRKRLRELRYPVIGLDIRVSKKKENGRVKSFYTLQSWRDIPPNHRELIREYENRTKSRALVKRTSEIR